MAKVKQIVFNVEDRPGTVAAAISGLSGAGVNILSVLGWGPQGVVQVVTDNPRKAVKALTASGIAFAESAAEVTELSNKPGALLAYLNKLAKKGVNLKSICSTSGKNAKKAVVVWTAHTATM